MEAHVFEGAPVSKYGISRAISFVENPDLFLAEEVVKAFQRSSLQCDPRIITRFEVLGVEPKQGSRYFEGLGNA